MSLEFFGAIATLAIPCIAPGLGASSQAVPQQLAAGTVFGRVVDVRGRAIPAARVSVRRVAAVGEVDVAAGKSDGTGTFIISGIEGPVRGLLVEVAASGRSRFKTQLEDAGEPVVAVLAEAVELAGVVPRVGDVVASGVVIRCRPTNEAYGSVVVEGVSNQDGTFTLREVPVGPVVVAALAAPKVLCIGHAVAGRDESVSLKPIDTVWLHVKLSWVGDGAPRNVGVHIQPVDSADGMDLAWRDSVAGDGRWEGYLPDGQCDMYWTSPGFLFSPASLNLIPGESTREVEVSCFKSADAPPVVLHVSDEEGKPVVGAGVVVRRLWPPSIGWGATGASGHATVACGANMGEKLIITSATLGWIVDGTEG